MSVHFSSKSAPAATRYNYRQGQELLREYQARQEYVGQTLADVVGKTEQGHTIVAEAKTRAQKVLDDVAHTEQELRHIAEDVFGGLLGQEILVVRARNQGRFQALAWGTMTEKVMAAWKAAPYDPKAYAFGFEALTGRACQFVPRAVYANAASL